MNRENLERGAAGLWALPDDYEHFDMATFFSRGMQEFKPDTKANLNICGTVACALGHFPSFGMPGLHDEEWIGYSYRVTGLDICRAGEWDWCFGQDWAYTPYNAAKHAASRIWWLLDRGLPDDWLPQIVGNVPLCCEGYGQ